MKTSPGYGTLHVHLGQTSSDLVKSFGKPSRRQISSALREYWVYPELHFEAIVSRRSENLLSLFFHKGSTLGGAEFFGKSEDSIRELLGEPQKSGGGKTCDDGDFWGRWLAYETGITFFLGRAGKVKMVSVSAPKRVSPRASVVRHAAGVSTRVAAFRHA